MLGRTVSALARNCNDYNRYRVSGRDRFLNSLFAMMRLDLCAPDYTTLSRRGQHGQPRLRPALTGDGIHLVLDSTGLSIVGEGEWAAAKHGGRGRRGWKKLHLGVDRSGMILAHTVLAPLAVDQSLYA